MRRTTATAGLLVAMILGHLAGSQKEKSAAQEALSPARAERFLVHANPLLEHMAKDLATRCSLSGEQQEQLIGALRPAAVEASLQSNAREEEEGLVRPRHLLRSEAIWKAMSTVLSPAQVAEYRKTVQAHFDRADRAIAGMWISWLDEAVGLSVEQRKAFAELLAGNTEGDGWSLTPLEALSLGDEWMRLVAARSQQAVENLSPEQKRERKPLLTPKQMELFVLQSTEEERKTDIREHGYPDTKGDNIEGRREIAQAAVAMHMELLGPLQPSARERLDRVAKEFVEHHLESEEGICHQADTGEYPRFAETIRNVLSARAYTAYEEAQKQRQSSIENAFREFLLAGLEDHLFLLDEIHRKRMREASQNIPLPTEQVNNSLPRYLASVLKSLPDDARSAWEQQQIDLLRRFFGSAWSNVTDTPERSPELQVLDRFVGAWEHEITVKPAGEEATQIETVDYRFWSRGGRILHFSNPTDDPEFHMSLTYDLQTETYSGVMLIGSVRALVTATWDAERNTMVFAMKYSNGNTYAGEHHFLGKDRAEASATVKNADGDVVLKLHWKQTRRDAVANAESREE